MKKGFITILFVFTILLGYSMWNKKTINQVSIESTLSTENSKIQFEGFNLNQSSSEDEISEEVNQESVSNVTVQVQFDYDSSSLDYRYVPTRRSNVDTYLQTLRASQKLYHTTLNEELLRDLNLGFYEDYYVSSYAPLVEFNYEPEEFVEHAEEIIGTIVDSDSVSTAYIQNVVKDESNTYLTPYYTVGVYNTVINGTYTGDGVTIGVLEESGIIDKKNTNFANTDLVIRDEWYFVEKVGEHATQVASILGGTYGIAPEAKLLSVQLVGTPNSEIDWLIDKGANVINLSWGDIDATGIYNSKSAYMDYVVRNSFVTIVAAVGNFGEDSGYVGNPALGYNVIGVGATTPMGDFVEPFSSYKELVGPEKPTIVAPDAFSVVTFEGLQIGTSYSAPVVTGSIALMMEQYPDLKAYPEKIISMVTSGAKYMVGDGDYLTSTGLFEMSGAGLFNYSRSISAYYTTYSQYNTTGVSGTVYTYSVYIGYLQTIRTSLTWLIPSTGSTTVSFTDYDLRLFDPTGRPVKSSTSGYNNLEFIEYTSVIPGTYRIVVTQNGSIVGSGDWLSVSYYLK